MKFNVNKVEAERLKNELSSQIGNDFILNNANRKYKLLEVKRLTKHVKDKKTDKTYEVIVKCYDYETPQIPLVEKAQTFLKNFSEFK